MAPTYSSIPAKLPAVILALIAALHMDLHHINAGEPDSPQKQAQQILQASGVRGGLIVHLGCGDGALTASLRADDRFLVHGLDADSANVRRARKHIEAMGLYGDVCVERFSGSQLPYADRLVNLLVRDDPGTVSEQEILRVLAPGGVAMVRRGKEWEKIVKPWPDTIDQWTHYQYDARGNTVGRDVEVGPPRHLRWTAAPLWSRSHETMSSLSAMVSAKGRLFYIIDEGPAASTLLPAKWFLVGRDAFSGVALWKRPIECWQTHYWPWKSGPAIMPRKLIAVGDRVYAPLGINESLSELDAATGEVLRTYKDTRAAEEVILSNGVLLVVVNQHPGNPADMEAKCRQRRHWNYDWKHHVLLDHSAERRVVALRPRTGEVLWRSKAAGVMPMTLAAEQMSAFFHDGKRVVCLDLQSGKTRWMSPSLPVPSVMSAEQAPTLVAYEDIVLFAWGGKLRALASETGEVLWECKCSRGDFKSPVSVLVLGGLVWTMDLTIVHDSGECVGRDPRTGEIRKRFRPAEPFRGMYHHRCHKTKATGRYILTSRSGVEYVDPIAGTYQEHHWVRGACLYGILPCNGLLYATPHPCACYIKAMLNGIVALAPERKPRVENPESQPDNRLERGPAYEEIRNLKSEIRNEEDWPTYRHDAERSGFAPSAVPVELGRLWQAQLGDRLSSLTLASGRLFVASVDTHTVSCLDAASGKILWSYTAGGRVDSPPTIWHGRVLFGAADGYVYCLRASDGILVWRFRAAPVERRVVAFGRVESPWPVPGSVLVQDDVLYCTAGRSSFLDGGIRLVQLDPATGKLLSESTVTHLDPRTGRQPPVSGSGLFEMDGALHDILSSDGKSVFMRHLRFDLEGHPRQDKSPHLFSPAGYLDDTWRHRAYWVYGDDTKAGFSGWWRMGNVVPSGRILVMDEKHVYGFGRSYYPGLNAAQFSRGERYHLYAADKARGERPDYSEVTRVLRRGRDADWSKLIGERFCWRVRPPLHARALVLADSVLFAAGPAGNTIISEPAFEGKQGGRLAAFSASDGKTLACYRLDGVPVFDGMAAARGRLFLSTTDGSVLCLGAGGKPIGRVAPEPVPDFKEELLPSSTPDRPIIRKQP